MDANAGLNHPAGPYAPGYDPPFKLILQNRNDSLLAPTVETWCGGGVTIELRGPDGKLMPRIPPPCEVPQSTNPVTTHFANYSLALTLYLYDLGYDLCPPGEYK